jgi:uncharacterized protein (TIGR03435 family)
MLFLLPSLAAGLLPVQSTAQQAAPAPMMAFDVSIAKRSKDGPNPNGYNHKITPLGLTMRGVSMGYCVRLAYNLTVQRPYELVAPSWLDPPTEFTYDVSGKCDQPVTPEKIGLMLQTLLRGRFKLAVHREKRDLPAYLLTLDAHQIGLHPSADSAERKIKSGSKPNQYIFEHVSMADLALQFGPPMTSRPVVDMTGLEGSFDFTLDLNSYLTDSETGKLSPSADVRIDFETAIIRAAHEQLGLTLKPGRTPVDVLVVDHVEKSPTDN